MGFLFSRPKVEQPKPVDPVSIGNVSSQRFPTNELAVPIPWSFGFNIISGTYMSQIFNNSADPITQTSQAPSGGKGGGSSSVTTTTGYNYSGSYAMLLCIGPVNRLTRIFAGDDIIWTGDLDISSANEDGYTAITTLKGLIRFYWGTDSQSVDEEMAAAIGPMPSYQHFCYAVASDLDFGQSTTPPSLRFEIIVLPSGLGDSDLDSDTDVASVAYEILTNTIHGCGINSDEFIDKDSFISAMEQMQDYDLGVSPLFKKVIQLRSAMSTLLAYANATLIYSNGKLALQVANDSIAPTPIATITDEDLVEEPVLTSDSWDNTWNETRANFTDRERDGNDNYAPYPDAANQQIVGRIIQKEFDRTYCTRMEVATKIAQSIGRQAGIPTTKAQLKVKSTVTGLEPGSVINLVYTKLGITKYYLRITSLEISGPADPGISIEAVEDVSRIKEVQPVDLGPIVIFDPMNATGIPKDTPDTLSPVSILGPVAAYFRIGDLTSDMLDGHLDGFLCAMRRPHGQIVGAAVYFGSSISGPWMLMGQITHFPVACKTIDFMIDGDKVYVTVKPLTSLDASKLPTLRDSLKDVYLITNRITVHADTPHIKQDVTPLIFKITYQGEFELVGDNEWKIECEMGEFSTLSLGGALPDGVSEYLSQDSFIGYEEELVIATNDNMKFSRSGGNFIGDTDQKRYVRVITQTRDQFLDINQSGYVFLNRLDVTMDDGGSFGALFSNGSTNYGDNGWWGRAVTNDFRVYVLTTPAIAYWRLGESSGDALDNVGSADATVNGDITREETGLIPDDPDLCILANGSDGIIEREFGADTIPIQVKAISLLVQLPFSIDPPQGRQTLAEFPHRCGLFIENGVLKAYRYDQIIEVDTGIGLYDGVTHHIVMTFDSSKIIVYVDGQVAATDHWTQSISHETRWQMAGRKNYLDSDVDQPFDGYLDEVILFSKNLSWEEVTDLWEATLNT
jgi:hypothetical protein